MPRRPKDSRTPHSGAARAIPHADDGPKRPMPPSEQIKLLTTAVYAINTVVIKSPATSHVKPTSEELAKFPDAVAKLYATSGSNGIGEFEKRYGVKVSDLAADTSEGAIARISYFGDIKQRSQVLHDTSNLLAEKRDALRAQGLRWKPARKPRLP